MTKGLLNKIFKQKSRVDKSKKFELPEKSYANYDLPVNEVSQKVKTNMADYIKNYPVYRYIL